MLMKNFIVLLIVCLCLIKDIGGSEEKHQEEGNDAENKNLRALDLFSPNSDTSDGIPHEVNEESRKRRRLRKRKRRPPILRVTETTTRKLQRLDEIREPWEEMTEDHQQSYNRRRLTPIYTETEEVSFEKIRDPFTALQEAQKKQKSQIEETTANLKALLKKSGELSLSEILQQKNLSLSELLKGNKQAISVLTQKTERTSQNGNYRKIQPSVALKKEINRNFEQVDDQLTSHEVGELQKKRLALWHKDSKLSSDVKKIEIAVTEAMTEAKTSDGPLKMYIDLDMTTRSSPKSTTYAGVKVKQVTAKEELMEILKNPVEREYLSRILRVRNMTVEELVKQRERGSSQLHLADIFHNKSREPEPKGDPFIGHVNSENFNNYPFFNRKQKSLQTSTNPPKYTITSFPTYKIETNRNVRTEQPFLPSWKQLYPSVFTDVYENKNREIVEATTKFIIDDDIENTLSAATISRFNNPNVYEQENDEDFINLPSGVKSAILASLAIISLSLLVFLSILVIFKWSQKQKRRLNYTGSFTGSRIKSPILEAEQNRRTFRSFMTETLGRKKNYYKAQLEKMSDTIWDDGKKPYMI